MKQQTLYVEKNFGSDRERGEDCTSLGQATADKYLICCLRTSAAAWTAGVSAQNNVKLHNNKIRERTALGKGSQPVD